MTMPMTSMKVAPQELKADGGELFSAEFLALAANTIHQAIKTDGFFILENALSVPAIEAILEDVDNHGFAINRNWAHGVYAEHQYYLTHMLACSRAFTRLATHPKLFEICDGILGHDYRLKAMRYYETYGKHHMQWHTDNKTDRGFAHIPGLIFIVYLADVDDGEFQYVRASHNWSGERAYSDYGDEEIEKNHGKDIVSFKAPRGTVIIYDTYGIHRARPVASRTFVRKSLFFQVDSKMDSAEPILLNPAYIDSIDAKTAQYLGFGLPAEYKVFPNTTIKNLQWGRVGLRMVSQWLAYRMARSLFDIMPHNIKKIIKARARRT